MIKIIRLGSANDGLSLPICRCLSQNGGLLHINSVSFTENIVKSPEFLFFETDSLEYMQSDNAIILTGSPVSINLFNSHSVNVLVDYKDKSSLTLPDDIKIITCGTSEKNSISVSSINETDALITVNTPLKLMNGDELYPCEISVTLTHPLETINVVKIAAILILSGKVKDERIII